MVIDSPALVISTLSGPVNLGIDSLDGGLLIFFHGPGESLDCNGEGSGVTSPMAVIIGLGIAEFVPGGDASALETASRTLGVRDTGRNELVEDVLCRNEDAWPARRLGLRIGVVGLMSVCIRNGPPAEPPGCSDGCANLDTFVGETAAGGDGAMV